MGRSRLSLLVTALLFSAGQVAGSSSAEQMKTFGTMGKAVYPFTEGSKTEATLFTHEGKGCLTHMWFGGNWENWERMRICVYVDGEPSASVDFEMFLGHGIGYKDDFGPWGTKRIGKTGQPSGVYNTYGSADKVENAHFPQEGHDYGQSKRMAMYPFMAKHLGLDISRVCGRDGKVDESFVGVEE